MNFEPIRRDEGRFQQSLQLELTLFPIELGVNPVEHKS